LLPMDNVASASDRHLQLSAQQPMPAVLFVQLRRFDHEGKKIYAELDVKDEEMLTLHSSLARADGSLDPDNLAATTYRLTSVSLHSGSHAGGHYTALVQYQPSGHWFYCNDRSISKRERSFVLSLPSKSFTPYILVYVRVSSTSVPLATVIAEQTALLQQLDQLVQEEAEENNGGDDEGGDKDEGGDDEGDGEGDPPE
jgi:hypothetical protein